MAARRDGGDRITHAALADWTAQDLMLPSGSS